MPIHEDEPPWDIPGDLRVAMALDVMDTIRAVMRGGRFKYSPLPPRNPVREAQSSTGIWSDRHKSALKFTMAAMFLLVVGYMVIAFM